MKKIVKRAIDYFEFTNSELKIIGFLTIAIVVGGAVTLWKATRPSPEIPIANLSQLERNFLERAQYAQGAKSKSKILTTRNVKTTKSTVSFLLNLNQATVEELTRLPTIGPQIAKRIIQFREQIGKFQRIEQLMEVKGIGEKRLKKIKQYLIISDNPER
ncbi:hypothetical protein DRQ12_01630 [candidate division KSB1 bacterium]|nr:MAG: hypothetical protein DRQ12_01630 [candidate division KSB1 bacterium]